MSSTRKIIHEPRITDSNDLRQGSIYGALNAILAWLAFRSRPSFPSWLGLSLLCDQHRRGTGQVHGVEIQTLTLPDT